MKPGRCGDIPELNQNAEARFSGVLSLFPAVASSRNLLLKESGCRSPIVGCSPERRASTTRRGSVCSDRMRSQSDKTFVGLWLPQGVHYAADRLRKFVSTNGRNTQKRRPISGQHRCLPNRTLILGFTNTATSAGQSFVRRAHAQFQTRSGSTQTSAIWCLVHQSEQVCQLTDRESVRYDNC